LNNRKAKSKKKDLNNLLDKNYDDDSESNMEDINKDVEKEQGRVNEE